MTTICEGCNIPLKEEEAYNHILLCRNAPFQYSDNPRVVQQAELFERCFQELENAENPHLYKYMPIGDFVLADLPCTDCPSFEKHMEGNCIDDLNVKNFMASANYMKKRAMNEYDIFLTRAVQHYTVIADSMDAEACGRLPHMNLNLIAAMHYVDECSKRREQERLEKLKRRGKEDKKKPAREKTQEEVDERKNYERATELADTADKIREIAAQREQLFRQKKLNLMDEIIRRKVEQLKHLNTLFLLKKALDGKLDSEFVKSFV